MVARQEGEVIVSHPAPGSNGPPDAHASASFAGACPAPRGRPARLRIRMPPLGNSRKHGNKRRPPCHPPFCETKPIPHGGFVFGAPQVPKTECNSWDHRMSDPGGRLGSFGDDFLFAGFPAPPARRAGRSRIPVPWLDRSLPWSARTVPCLPASPAPWSVGRLRDWPRSLPDWSCEDLPM